MCCITKIDSARIGVVPALARHTGESGEYPMSWDVKSRDDGRAMTRCSVWAAWGEQDQGQLGGYERQEAASPSEPVAKDERLCL